MLEKLHLQLSEEIDGEDIAIDLILTLSEDNDEILAYIETRPVIEDNESLLELLESTLGIISGVSEGIFIDLLEPTEANDDEIKDALATAIAFVQNELQA